MSPNGQCRARQHLRTISVRDPKELLRQLATLEALLGNVPDPIVFVGADGLVREANAAARELLPALRFGQPLSFGVRAPEILDAVARTSPGQSNFVDYSERVPTERTFDVQITSLPADSGGGSENAGVMLFFRDLTAARRLERMRVDFVANVSHELRTPLASLIGFIETLQGSARQDPQVWDRFLKIMRGQAWRMTRLIDDLLSLSRIELREHVAPSSPVDLHSVAAQIIDILSTVARECGVTIGLVAPEQPAMVLGDEDELSRMVENLVEN